MTSSGFSVANHAVSCASTPHLGGDPRQQHDDENHADQRRNAHEDRGQVRLEP